MRWVPLLTTIALGAQSPGLRLLPPSGANQVQLVDDQGTTLHSWPGTDNVTAHVLADGSLLRGVRSGTFTIGGSTGRLQQLAFDGTVSWNLLIDGPAQYMHHDIEPMPNGNVLVIAWDALSSFDAIAAGRDPALLSGLPWLPDAILEIERTGPTSGAIVWEWHLMDHLIQDFDPSKAGYGVVANHPELLDINYPPVVPAGGDWNHCNGLDYDPANDWILLSARSQHEIYLIDHSTTTAEAAGRTGGQRGKGGDILYRWGNPIAYRAGTAAHQQLFGQHDPRFIPPGSPGAGHVTVFNNDYLPAQSAVFELALPLDATGNIVLDPLTGRYGPVTPHWTFTEPGFHSAFVSSAERLPNGNTLICSGVQNRLLEVTAAGQTAWSHDYTGTGFLFQTHHVDRSLWIDTDQLPVGGGHVTFHHLVDSSHGGETYMLLGSISGRTPGAPQPGGVTLPLNIDFLTQAMATQFNVGIFQNTLGTVGALGGATSAIVAPAGFIPPALAGLPMDVAHLIFDGSLLAVHASNPVGITIVP